MKAFVVALSLFVATIAAGTAIGAAIANQASVPALGCNSAGCPR